MSEDRRSCTIGDIRDAAMQFEWQTGRGWAVCPKTRYKLAALVETRDGPDDWHLWGPGDVWLGRYRSRRSAQAGAVEHLSGAAPPEPPEFLQEMTTPQVHEAGSGGGDSGGDGE